MAEYLSERREKMDRSILEWLLAEFTPEVRLRTLKEYQKLTAFKVGNVGEENKWITLYAYMAQ